MNKTKIEFKPFKRADGKYAFQIWKDDKPLNKFVHWIETPAGPAFPNYRICSINTPEMIMSPVWTLEQAEAECAWMNNKYLLGELE